MSGNAGILELLNAFAGGKDGKKGGALADLKNMMSGDLKGEIEVVRKGEQIILPEDMTYDEAITWLLRYKTADEAVVAIHECVPALPFDGAVAFQKVLKARFGFVNLKATPGFFGPEPPAM